MDVVFIEHADERIVERGTNADEVKQVLATADTVPTKLGRIAEEAVFEYNSNWLGKYYKQKKVKVVYVEEQGKTMVITVYVYFGSWG
ncbi:MAG: DUF4258 domain-containing protein [Candidatus Aquicultor sp.]